jgi:cellulose biosynthesis protein BcsQ
VARLNLVIADFDERYLRGLSEYINTNHSSAFMASCFTKIGYFIDYMEGQPPVDVLIISPDFYDISAAYSHIKLRVMLSTGVLSREYPGFQLISKYSTGEKLVCEVVHLYSQLNPFETRLPNHSKNTKFIGVYSPAGGTGKTTIAAALSIQCAEQGMEAFYLNLESIQSTEVFFHSSNKRNLSYVFYYLKEMSSNLSFKMDGIKNTEDGVQYFSSPESPMEYDEINPVELERLIKGIKDMRCYDYVFIDMSNTFDMKNYKILNLCNHILMVTLHEPIALYKSRVMFNELVKLSVSDKNNVSDKIIIVINRYKDKSGEGADIYIEEYPVAVKLPEYSRTLIKEDGRVAVDDDDFTRGINQLISMVRGK